MSTPICVCISDIHFNINNLELASKSLRTALRKAEELCLPLVIAGDLNDTKAIIRAEVANEIIDILKPAKVQVLILVGNHDLINEKGDVNGLNYLKPYATIISEPGYYVWSGIKTHLAMIPYQNTTKKFEDAVKKISGRNIIVCHQGFMGAAMGDYIQDKTSIDPKLVKDFTVISGHYHKHQTVDTVTYIGSPYTTSFGEANDPSKGFLILNCDGTYTRELTNLRRHVIIEVTTQVALKLWNDLNFNTQDLIWIKISGTRSELDKIDKNQFKGVKLDLIPTDSNTSIENIENLTNSEILDKLIDGINESKDYKTELKAFWRNLV